MLSESIAIDSESTSTLIGWTLYFPQLIQKGGNGYGRDETESMKLIGKVLQETLYEIVSCVIQGAPQNYFLQVLKI